MKGDINFLNEWSGKLGVNKDIMFKEMEGFYAQLKEREPKTPEEMLFEKAKMMLRVKYKKKFLTNDSGFKGIIISYENPRDTWNQIRKRQLEVFEQYKSEGKEQVAVEKKIVRFDKTTGEVIPLCPMLKTDGMPSKKYGQDIGTPQETTKQILHGICTVDGDKENKVHPFSMEIGGTVAKEYFDTSKVYSFRAMNRGVDNSGILKLSSNIVEFEPIDDTYFKEGIEKLGMMGLVKRFFSKNVVRMDSIAAWRKTGEVPKHLQELLIVDGGVCMSMNLMPNQKGNINFVVENPDAPINENQSIRCVANKNLKSTVDFGEGSSVLVVGRCWVPNKNDGEEKDIVINLCGIFAYTEGKIPRIEVDELSENDVMLGEPAPVATKQISKPSVADKPPAKQFSVNAW